jgi:hypothetical protein
VSASLCTAELFVCDHHDLQLEVAYVNSAYGDAPGPNDPNRQKILHCYDFYYAPALEFFGVFGLLSDRPKEKFGQVVRLSR